MFELGFIREQSADVPEKGNNICSSNMTHWTEDRVEHKVLHDHKSGSNEPERISGHLFMSVDLS